MIYLDASLVVAALTNEPQSAAAWDWLESKNSRKLAVSCWTLVEVASALSVKVRTQTLTAEQQRWAFSALEVLAESSFNWALVTPLAEDFSLAQHLSGQAGLNVRGADALHIAIAHRQDWALATLDKKMRIAAGLAGVTCECDLPS